MRVGREKSGLARLSPPDRRSGSSETGGATATCTPPSLGGRFIPHLLIFRFRMLQFGLPFKRRPKEKMNEARFLKGSIAFEAWVVRVCTTASSSLDTDDQWIEPLGIPSQTTILHKLARVPDRPTRFLSGLIAEITRMYRKLSSISQVKSGHLASPALL
jgi:hypothetical protein